jgi:cytochrome c-type protein NapB
MNRGIAILVGMVAFVALGMTAFIVTGSQPDATSDRDVGLSKSNIFDTPTPAAFHPDESEPGEQAVLARPFVIAPPLVPHAVAEFLPITREVNACIECHQVAEKAEGEPTPIPASHYEDLRNAPGKTRPSPVGSRYNCTACHVSLTDASPLVGIDWPQGN